VLYHYGNAGPIRQQDALLSEHNNHLSDKRVHGITMGVIDQCRLLVKYLGYVLMLDI